MGENYGGLDPLNEGKRYPQLTKDMFCPDEGERTCLLLVKKYYTDGGTWMDPIAATIYTYSIGSMQIKGRPVYAPCLPLLTQERGTRNIYISTATIIQLIIISNNPSETEKGHVMLPSI